MHRMTLADFAAMSDSFRQPYQAAYHAFYSSAWNAIVTDPLLMMLPMDDHMVHRGDGVFEAFKCVEGAIYNLRAHLERLGISASGLRLALPVSVEELTRLTVETVRAGRRRDAVVRIFLSRGPGGFSVRPFECPRPHVYIVVTSLPAPFMERHPEGARIATSAIPLKPADLAVMKSCNYVPNVQMTMEAAEQGVDYTVSFDRDGHLGEGATENVGIVTRDGWLLFPRLDHILKGTTMMRVAALAEQAVARGDLAGVAFTDIPRLAVAAAREILLVGTTIDVVAAVAFDGKPVGDGKPGTACRMLNDSLRRDIRENTALRTPVFE